MAALLVEICKDVQLSDIERAFIIFLLGSWFFALPICYLRVIFRNRGGKKDGTEV